MHLTLKAGVIVAAVLASGAMQSASKVNAQGINAQSTPNAPTDRSRLVDALAKTTDPAKTIDIKIQIAGLDFSERKFADAEAGLNALLNQKNPAISQGTKAAVEKFVGDCEYKQAHYPEALTIYNSSVSDAEAAHENKCLYIDALWSKAATLFTLKRFTDSVPPLKTAMSMLPQDDVALVWGHLNLGDTFAQLQDKNGEHESRTAAAQTLRRRMQQTSANSPCQSLRGGYRLWHMLYGTPHLMPVVRFKPEGTPVAAVICIHGLGLDSRSYVPLATQLAFKGFFVLSMDVRGFGAWQNNQGHETLDLERALDDIHGVCNAVHAAQPGLPVFLLGESMGGGIAVHAASKYHDDWDGVICSVPGASRQNEASRAFMVVVHLLRDPDEQYNVGESLIGSMTTDEAMLHRLNNDPEGRQDMSARELMQFNKFMRQNKKVATHVTSPILMTQGDRDKLVKESSTMDIFHALQSPDRNLMLLGRGEHLIFESQQIPPVMLDAVSAWMRAHHSVASNATGAPTTGQAIAPATTTPAATPTSGK